MKNATDITIILDRSGSMTSVRKDTIGGFNTFVESQQKLPGDCSLSLVQFDTVYEVVYQSKPIKDAPLLTDATFEPRGSTALLDAIGKTINDTGTRLAGMQQEDRPEKVMIVILTDGEENSSHEFNRAQILGMIKRQTEVYKWDFVFLGANQDAIAVGASMGVNAGKSMSYASNQKGTQDVFASMASYTQSVRSSALGNVADISFSAEDRQKQKDAGAQ